MTGPEPFKDLSYEQQARIAKRLRRIADILERELDKAAGTRVCFSLLTWGTGRVQYISNGNREDTSKALRELLGRWDDPAQELGIPTLKDKQ